MAVLVVALGLYVVLAGLVILRAIA